MSDDLRKTGDPSFEIITATYARMHRKQDTRAITETIRQRFSSGHALYMANRHTWERMGLKPNDALLMSLLKDVTRYTLYTSYGKHPRIDTLEHASDYLAANFLGFSEERFYMFSVNRRGCLKERILLNAGIADTALFNLRKLMQETVRLKPLGGVIIAHNHPGGTTRPSPDDIACTMDAIDALSAMGVPLLDHVIVAGKTAVSMRENGFLPEGIWLEQHPRHRILHEWLIKDEDRKPADKKKKGK